VTDRPSSGANNIAIAELFSYLALLSTKHLMSKTMKSATAIPTTPAPATPTMPDPHGPTSVQPMDVTKDSPGEAVIAEEDNESNRPWSELPAPPEDFGELYTCDKSIIALAKGVGFSEKRRIFFIHRWPTPLHGCPYFSVSYLQMKEYIGYDDDIRIGEIHLDHPIPQGYLELCEAFGENVDPVQASFSTVTYDSDAEDSIRAVISGPLPFYTLFPKGAQPQDRPKPMKSSAAPHSSSKGNGGYMQGGKGQSGKGKPTGFGNKKPYDDNWSTK
jgi:hypothetical protein